MTLALLLTAVTGAWATDGVIMKELTVPSEWKTDENPLTADEMTGFKDFSSLTDDEAKALLNSVPTGNVVIIYGVGASSNSFKVVQSYEADVHVAELPLSHSDFFDLKDQSKFYYTASDGIEVTPVAGKTNEWTFSMPGSDVVLTPQYAPAAKWDLVEGVEQQPAALEGIIAGQDAAIVTAGQSAQGTVMYAVTTTAEPAPALTAFSATVPTAKNYDDAATLYVWYYIKGADAPQGQTATAENTFNDSEICTTPLKVTVLTNKFDIQFNAANANTIEAGKATVTVGGTAATVTEGKLQGVKMGSEVKVKANTGYKFRKVEVKKKTAGPTTITVTWNGADITGTGGGKSFTKDGVTITADDIEFMDKNFIGGGTFTTTLGNFTKIEVTTDGWYASGTGWSGSTWTGNASSVSFSGEIMGYGGGNLKFVFTIEPTN